MFSKIVPNISNSLTFRLAVSYAVVASLFSILALGVFYYKLVQVTMEAVDSELLEETEEFLDLYMEQGLTGVIEEIKEENQSEDTSRSFFRLFDSLGEVIATTDMSDWSQLLYDTQFELKISAETTHIDNFQLAERPYKDRIITMKIDSDLYFQHGQTLEASQEYLKIFRRLFIVVVIISLVMGGFAGGLMAKNALRGMNHVAHTAQLIAKGRYHERVRISSRYNEINHLADTFNVMVDRIQDLVGRMREVTENIAHDLRSPLARIRGIAEMSLISKSNTLTPSQAAENTIEECDNLIETINTMLDLTEIEAGVQKLDIGPIALNTLLEEACELFYPLAKENNITINLDVDGTITLYSDGARLQRLLYNLLDNAIKYSPLDGSINIKARIDKNQVLIEVEDNGIGIAQDDLPYIFNRFYRADRSRSKPGTGLGLSMVKAIAIALGGSVTVDTQLNQGSRFLILLPQLLTITI